MKIVYHILIVLLFFSCTPTSKKTVVLANNTINKSVLPSLKEPEKALVLWYLYAYGNACDGTTDKPKCEILKTLHITDECNPKHLSFLMQWFSTDMLAVYKLNKCPSLPVKSAIQNEFEKIILQRKKDTLIIDFKIKGMNNSQEKSWNIEKTEAYVIRDKTLVKL